MPSGGRDGPRRCGPLGSRDGDLSEDEGQHASPRGPGGLARRPESDRGGAGESRGLPQPLRSSRRGRTRTVPERPVRPRGPAGRTGERAVVRRESDDPAPGLGVLEPRDGHAGTRGAGPLQADRLARRRRRPAGRDPLAPRRPRTPFRRPPSGPRGARPGARPPAGLSGAGSGGDRSRARGRLSRNGGASLGRKGASADPDGDDEDGFGLDARPSTGKDAALFALSEETRVVGIERLVEPRESLR